MADTWQCPLCKSIYRKPNFVLQMTELRQQLGSFDVGISSEPSPRCSQCSFEADVNQMLAGDYDYSGGEISEHGHSTAQPLKVSEPASASAKPVRLPLIIGIVLAIMLCACACLAGAVIYNSPAAQSFLAPTTSENPQATATPLQPVMLSPTATMPPPPTPTPAAAPVPEGESPADSEPLIHESFDDNQNGWNVVDETKSWGKVKVDIENNVLKASGVLKDSIYYSFYPSFQELSDAEVSVDVKNISAYSEKTEYGLVLYARGNYEHILFMITDTGTFTVMSYLDDVYNFYALDQPSNAIHRGATNRLTAKMQGNHFTFYINKVQVFEMDVANLPTRGKVGVHIDWIDAPGVDQVIEFDNFVVSTP